MRHKFGFCNCRHENQLGTGNAQALLLPAGIKILADYGHVEEAYGLSPAELCQKIKDFDALIIRSSTQVAQLIPCTCPLCMLWCAWSELATANKVTLPVIVPGDKRRL